MAELISAKIPRLFSALTWTTDLVMLDPRAGPGDLDPALRIGAEEIDAVRLMH